MTKRRSSIAAFALSAVFFLALIFGIALPGGTLTAQAEDSTSSDSEIPTYDLYLTLGTLEADGKTSTSTGQAVAHLKVSEGTLVTITAQERSDAVFEKWDYSAVVNVVFADETSASTTFVMPKDGVWLEPKYKLIRSVTVENGILEGGATSGKYTEGETVRITAEPTRGGKTFVKWFVKSGDVTLADENSTTTTFDMPRGDVSITALYQSEHNLALVSERPATCTENGIRKHYVCEECGRKFTDETEEVEITDDSVLLIPMAHKFGEWIDEVPATEEATGKKAHKTCEFCHKNFDKDGNEIDDLTLYKTYRVLLRWGTIKAGEETSAGTGRDYAQLDVRAGTVVTITAPEKSDAVFSRWTYSAVVEVAFTDENSVTTTFVMPKGDVWLDTEYNLIGSVTVENGILEGGATSGKYTEGGTVKITANEAPEGKEFDKWVIVSGEVSLADENSSETTFVMPDSAVEIRATYKEKAPGGDEPGTDDPGTDTPSGDITPPEEKKGLSGGAIAGIAVGGVAVAGVGGFSIFWFAIRKKSFAELIAAIKGLFVKK